jgi:hypothetical protein
VLVPASLRSLVKEERFWRCFFFEEEGHFPELADLEVRFPAGDGYGLSLFLDDRLAGMALGLRMPDEADALQLGWDDQAHWHPHALRWTELDHFARAVALEDPDLPHPGLVVALLHRFAPICVGDDVDAIHPLLEGALQSCGLPPAEIERAIERADHRQDGFRWTEDGTLEQDQAARECGYACLYTLRSAGGSFPFAAYAAFLHRVRARLSRAGMEPSLLPPAPGPTRFKQRVQYRLTLDLTGRVDSLAGRLHDALSERGLGDAQIGGMTTGPHLRLTHIYVHVRDDLDGGLALIRDVLEREGVELLRARLQAPERRDVDLRRVRPA